MTTVIIKLAEALLRRKELQEKVEVLKKFKENQLYYEIRGERKRVTEGLDDLNVNYPKLSAAEVTEEFDWHARQLRLIDGAIQNTNWTTTLEVAATTVSDYVPKLHVK